MVYICCSVIGGICSSRSVPRIRRIGGLFVCRWRSEPSNLICARNSLLISGSGRSPEVIMTFGGPFDCVGIGGAAFAAPDMHQTPEKANDRNDQMKPGMRQERPTPA